MFNLYKHNDIVFTGTHRECLMYLEDKDIEYSAGYVFYTYDDVKYNRPATYKIVRINN